MVGVARARRRVYVCMSALTNPSSSIFLLPHTAWLRLVSCSALLPHGCAVAVSRCVRREQPACSPINAIINTRHCNLVPQHTPNITTPNPYQTPCNPPGDIDHVSHSGVGRHHSCPSLQQLQQQLHEREDAVKGAVGVALVKQLQINTVAVIHQHCYNHKAPNPASSLSPPPQLQGSRCSKQQQLQNSPLLPPPLLLPPPPPLLLMLTTKNCCCSAQLMPRRSRARSIRTRCT